MKRATSKDWERMMKLVLTGDDGSKVSNSIKDQEKAAIRYVCGTKLKGRQPEWNDTLNRYSGCFGPLANRSIELGSTRDDIESLFNIVEVPVGILDKVQELSTKELDNRFVGKISMAVLDMGHDIRFIGNGGNAITWEGQDAMDGNGRKWTIGYRSIITIYGVEYRLDFDAITCEGGGPTQYVVANTDLIWPIGPIGINELIKKIKSSIQKKELV